MFIAFEGPDNTGKSTSALNLIRGRDAERLERAPLYNMTKQMHRHQQEGLESSRGLGVVQTYDRIDWFTHMVYRLSMPDRDWNDDRPRTVFAMPDTHLVVKLHHPQLAELISDELYETGKLALVNPMYYYFADFFTGLNQQQGFSLFKTVSVMEVLNDPRDGSFSQRLVEFSSPVLEWSDVGDLEVASDEDLLEVLRYDERCRG